MPYQFAQNQVFGGNEIYRSSLDGFSHSAVQLFFLKRPVFDDPEVNFDPGLPVNKIKLPPVRKGPMHRVLADIICHAYCPQGLGENSDIRRLHRNNDVGIGGKSRPSPNMQSHPAGNCIRNARSIQDICYCRENVSRIYRFFHSRNAWDSTLSPNAKALRRVLFFHRRSSCETYRPEYLARFSLLEIS